MYILEQWTTWDGVMWMFIIDGKNPEATNKTGKIVKEIKNHKNYYKEGYNYTIDIGYSCEKILDQDEDLDKLIERTFLNLL